MGMGHGSGLTLREREQRRVKKQRLAVVWLLVFLGLAAFFVFSSGRQVTITVQAKDQITRREHRVRTRIWIVRTDDEVYEVSPSVVFMAFDADRIYRKLRVGQTYRVKLAGWRVPYFKYYPTIIELVEGPGVRPGS